MSTKYCAPTGTGAPKQVVEKFAEDIAKSLGFASDGSFYVPSWMITPPLADLPLTDETAGHAAVTATVVPRHAQVSVQVESNGGAI